MTYVKDSEQEACASLSSTIFSRTFSALIYCYLAKCAQYLCRNMQITQQIFRIRPSLQTGK
jgi:hypothetical protein